MIEHSNSEDLKEMAYNQEFLKLLNVPDWRGDTPIIMALKEGKTEIIKILLRCPRVDLNVVDINFQHLEDIARLVCEVVLY